MNLVVYTAVTGKYDELPTVNEKGVEFWGKGKGGGRYVAYVDEEQKGGKGWEKRPFLHFSLHEHWKDRRDARFYKMMPHLLFPEAEYSIWVDGGWILLEEPRKMLQYLGDNDIAMFDHHRNCIYQEMEAIKRNEWEDPEILKRHYEHYRDKLAPNEGLTATGLIIRRHTPEIARLNQAWWEQICQFSSRDQLSFVFVAKQLGVKWSLIPGRHNSSDLFTSNPAGH